MTLSKECQTRRKNNGLIQTSYTGGANQSREWKQRAKGAIQGDRQTETKGVAKMQAIELRAPGFVQIKGWVNQGRTEV